MTDRPLLSQTTKDALRLALQDFRQDALIGAAVIAGAFVMILLLGVLDKVGIIP